MFTIISMLYNVCCLLNSNCIRLGAATVLTNSRAIIFNWSSLFLWVTSWWFLFTKPRYTREATVAHRKHTALAGRHSSKSADKSGHCSKAQHPASLEIREWYLHYEINIRDSNMASGAWVCIPTLPLCNLGQIV